MSEKLDTINYKPIIHKEIGRLINTFPEYSMGELFYAMYNVAVKLFDDVNSITDFLDKDKISDKKFYKIIEKTISYEQE